MDYDEEADFGESEVSDSCVLDSLRRRSSVASLGSTGSSSRVPREEVSGSESDSRRPKKKSKARLHRTARATHRTAPRDPRGQTAALYLHL